MVGFVWSRLNGALVTDAVFLALSVAVPLKIWFAPSVATI